MILAGELMPAQHMMPASSAWISLVIQVLVPEMALAICVVCVTSQWKKREFVGPISATREAPLEGEMSRTEMKAPLEARCSAVARPSPEALAGS